MDSFRPRLQSATLDCWLKRSSVAAVLHGFFCLGPDVSSVRWLPCTLQLGLCGPGHCPPLASGFVLVPRRRARVARLVSLFFRLLLSLRCVPLLGCFFFPCFAFRFVDLLWGCWPVFFCVVAVLFLGLPPFLLRCLPCSWSSPPDPCSLLVLCFLFLGLRGGFPLTARCPALRFLGLSAFRCGVAVQAFPLSSCCPPLARLCARSSFFLSGTCSHRRLRLAWAPPRSPPPLSCSPFWLPVSTFLCSLVDALPLRFCARLAHPVPCLLPLPFATFCFGSFCARLLMDLAFGWCRCGPAAFLLRLLPSNPPTPSLWFGLCCGCCVALAPWRRPRPPLSLSTALARCCCSYPLFALPLSASFLCPPPAAPLLLHPILRPLQCPNFTCPVAARPAVAFRLVASHSQSALPSRAHFAAPFCFARLLNRPGPPAFRCVPIRPLEAPAPPPPPHLARLPSAPLSRLRFCCCAVSWSWLLLHHSTRFSCRCSALGVRFFGLRPAFPAVGLLSATW